MPKITKPEKKRKKRAYTSKYSNDMIDIAVEAMKKKTMSSYEAEKTFGIPRRTLLDKLHNKHPKSPGCPTKLTNKEEANIIKVLITAAEYGSPLTLVDLRIVVYRYLEGNGRLSIFNNKLPGKKWAYSFLKRNKSKLTYRIVQNIKRSRAEKTPDEMKEYFINLKSSIEGVPSENILNYDETNLTDNPGAEKCLFRRGVKYPERVLNNTKGAISIMFAITAGGECLPPYVVYKAEHLYTQWTINGPKGSRFNRSKSGWFDSLLFEDWFESIILPWAKNKPGKKNLIGDNLASHINFKIVKYCEQNDICFVFLPPNSSHLTQPLDVCYFGPLKKLWREILLTYKIKNPREATINKAHFPDLLKNLMGRLNEKTNNISSAFDSTGIMPFNPDKVIKKLPGLSQEPMTYTIDKALLDWLKETRSANPNKKVRNKKLNVPPGKSVGTNDFKDCTVQPKRVKTANKKQNEKNSRRMPVTSESVLSLLPQNSPDSLKQLCVRSVNKYLFPCNVHNSETPSPQVIKVLTLNELSRENEENISFINNLPACLQSKKKKIEIISDVTINAGPSLKNQHCKKSKTSLKKTGITINRSALDMKLMPIKKERNAKERKVLKEIPQERQETTRKRKIERREITKEKNKMMKKKSVKLKMKRSRSQSSSSTDIEISIANSDGSEYETLDDFITFSKEEEEDKYDNIEEPYGISDIKYYTQDTNKLQPGSWILAKFVTKKNEKHYVGKVISVKDDVPEVKFVRKVKESKLKSGVIFTYPTVDDICNMKHLEDIILILPEPQICRRGQIMFNIDLSNYNVQ